MSRIPEHIIERIRTATDIVEVVGERVELQHRGRNWVGLCPFHVEKTPSFNVNPEWGTFKCFGCGRSGGVFQFVMDHDQLTFPEAVAELGRRAGVPVETGVDPREEDELAALRKTVAWASACFQKCLWSPQGERPRGYLASRGFTEETLRAFGVGYAPESWDWLLGGATRARRAEGWGPSEAMLVRVGLAKARAESNPGKEGAYDAFRDRVIFPILDRRGRPIGFGGRIMPDARKADEAPKYINSPESPLYRKSRALFGYHQGADAIRRSGQVIVAEGYTDVMMAHQCGVGEVVACCGTALTDDHAQLLARVARKRVVFLFDGDAAGQRAAERSIDLLLPLERDVSVVTLPDGDDPHEFLHARGAEAFAQALQSGRGLWEFKLEALAQRYDMRSPQAKAQAIDELIAALARVPNPIERDLQSQALALKLGVEPRLFAARQRQRQPHPSSAGPPRGPGRPGMGPAGAGPGMGRDSRSGAHEPGPRPDGIGLPAEAFLLEVLAHRPDLVEHVVASYPLGNYRHDGVRQVAEVLYERLGGGAGSREHPGLGGLVALLESRDMKLGARLLLAAAERTANVEELDRHLSVFFAKAAKRDIMRRRKALEDELEQAVQARDDERKQAILAEINALLRSAPSGRS